MKKSVISSNLSNVAIEVEIQEALFYTPAALRLTDSDSSIELLLNDQQLLQLEQALGEYKLRLIAKGEATV